MSEADDWRLELARLVLAPQVAGMAIIAILVAFVFHPFAKAVAEIPSSLNRLTQQVARVEDTLSKHATLLDDLSRKADRRDAR